MQAVCGLGSPTVTVAVRVPRKIVYIPALSAGVLHVATIDRQSSVQVPVVSLHEKSASTRTV